MKRVCYICSALLALAWIGSFFFLHTGAGTHIFILAALVCWMHGLISVSQKKYTLDQPETMS